jgi:hypothetical protein
MYPFVPWNTFTLNRALLWFGVKFVCFLPAPLRLARPGFLGTWELSVFDGQKGCDSDDKKDNGNPDRASAFTLVDSFHNYDRYYWFSVRRCF